MGFDDFLNSLSTMWGGVAHITHTISADAAASLEASDTSQDAVREVIRESINNAIFHGCASEVIIRVDHLSDDVLHLVVEDNGKGRDGEMNFGLGSKLMDTVTLNWTLRKGSPHNGSGGTFRYRKCPCCTGALTPEHSRSGNSARPVRLKQWHTSSALIKSHSSTQPKLS